MHRHHFAAAAYRASRLVHTCNSQPTSGLGCGRKRALTAENMAREGGGVVLGLGEWCDSAYSPRTRGNTQSTMFTAILHREGLPHLETSPTVCALLYNASQSKRVRNTVVLLVHLPVSSLPATGDVVGSELATMLCCVGDRERTKPNTVVACATAVWARQVGKGGALKDIRSRTSNMRPTSSAQASRHEAE